MDRFGFVPAHYYMTLGIGVGIGAGTALPIQLIECFVGLKEEGELTGLGPLSSTQVDPKQKDPEQNSRGKKVEPSEAMKFSSSIGKILL